MASAIGSPNPRPSSTAQSSRPPRRARAGRAASRPPRSADRRQLRRGLPMRRCRCLSCTSSGGGVPAVVGLQYQLNTGLAVKFAPEGIEQQIPPFPWLPFEDGYEGERSRRVRRR